MSIITFEYADFCTKMSLILNTSARNFITQRTLIHNSEMFLYFLVQFRKRVVYSRFHDHVAFVKNFVTFHILVPNVADRRASFSNIERTQFEILTHSL